MRRTPSPQLYWSSRLIGLLFGLLFGTSAWAGTKNTGFVPTTHGFGFENTFSNDFIKDLDIRTGGLCGGMVYSALDYYHARRAIPRQDYRPANRTPLQSYIYGRQVASLPPNLAKWADVGTNPDGARNGELFRRGLESEFAALRTAIDAGNPAPLGMHGTTGTTHQVLAIGYDSDAAGRLVAIRIYDPNHRNEVVTMRPNADKQWYEYAGHDERWRTYFVDRSYVKVSPPSIGTPNYPSDGKIRELIVEIATGNDDMRGGNDNVGLTLNLRGGGKITRPNINLGARWLSNYVEFASVSIPPTRKEDILSFELLTTFGGGIGGDNWDTTRVIVHAYDGGTHHSQLVHRSAFFRFTGAARLLRIPMPGATTPGLVTALKLEIVTGGDDLRGGNDNVNATIRFKDGTSQQINNLNARKTWPNHASNTVTLTLGTARPRADIVGVTLTTTFGGGMGGDNWNMDSIVIKPVIDGEDATQYIKRTGSPVKRFTGSDKTLALTW